MFNKKIKLPFTRKNTKQPPEKMKEQIEKETNEQQSSYNKPIPSSGEDLKQQVTAALHNPADLVIKNISPNFTLIYIDDLVDTRPLNEQILRDLYKNTHASPEKIKQFLTIPKVDLSSNLDESVMALLNGSVTKEG